MIGRTGQAQDRIDRKDQAPTGLDAAVRSVAHQPQREVAVVGVDGVVHRGQQVFLLNDQAPARDGLPGAEEIPVQATSQLAEVLGVCRA